MLTAVISVTSSVITSSSRVFSLLNHLATCDSLWEIIILWSSSVQPPPVKDWIFLGRLPQHTSLKIIQSNSSSTRFASIQTVSTAALLLLDEDIDITTEEINFAFQVWKIFPNRIVGFPSRTHFWDEKKKLWSYSSAMANEYSLILTNAAFIHRKYARIFTEYLSVSLTSAIQTYSDCEHILMNFLVSHITKQSPIKVTSRNCQNIEFSPKLDQSELAQKFSRKQTCLNIFASGFGYMPLIKSKLRLDPVLFKDPVSNMRKKYRKIELVQ